MDGANPQGGGRHQAIILVIFSWKLNEIERNWTGDASLAPPWIRHWILLLHDERYITWKGKAQVQNDLF